MSDGVVTTAVLWRLVTELVLIGRCLSGSGLLVGGGGRWVVGSLRSELGEQVVETIEPGVPGPLEGADPVVDRLERRPVDPVPVVPTLDPDGHQVDRSQHAEVLGHLGLAEAQAPDELAHRGLPGAEGVEEVAAARLGDGVEHVRRRCRASHGANYMSISEYVEVGRDEADRSSRHRDLRRRRRGRGAEPPARRDGCRTGHVVVVAAGPRAADGETSGGRLRRRAPSWCGRRLRRLATRGSAPADRIARRPRRSRWPTTDVR